VGIAKTSEVAQVREAITPTKVSEPSTSVEPLPIHPEVYRFFNLNMNSDDERLRIVNDWAEKDSPSIAETLHRIKTLETKLGQPSTGETRLAKLSNYVRVVKHIDDISTNMDREIVSVKDKHKTRMDGIDKTHKEKISRIRSELEKAEANYSRASEAYKIHSTNQLRAIRDEYDRQLKDLRKLQKLYGGRK
jgi:hypothetical protein